MTQKPSFDVLAPGGDHWFARFADDLVAALHPIGHARRWKHHRDLPSGDVAFVLSYPRIIPAPVLARHHSNVVAHASALPRGRGMSPMPWQILEGVRDLPVTLFEAVPELDAGQVYLRSTIATRGDELLPELQEELGRVIVDLCLRYASAYPEIHLRGEPQIGEPTYYRLRTPADSEIDPYRSIAEQFELLRVVDNDRYPAFFKFRGTTYRLSIERAEESNLPDRAGHDTASGGSTDG